MSELLGYCLVFHAQTRVSVTIAAGCRLAWLIDPQARKTWVYADNGDVQTIPFEQALSGGAVLSDFELKLADIFTAWHHSCLAAGDAAARKKS